LDHKLFKKNENLKLIIETIFKWKVVVLDVVRRHIIAPDVQLCVTGCGGMETQHIICSCQRLGWYVSG
jgi:hypothetical protein